MFAECNLNVWQQLLILLLYLVIKWLIWLRVNYELTVWGKPPTLLHLFRFFFVFCGVDPDKSLNASGLGDDFKTFRYLIGLISSPVNCVEFILILIPLCCRLSSMLHLNLRESTWTSCQAGRFTFFDRNHW